MREVTNPETVESQEAVVSGASNCSLLEVPVDLYFDKPSLGDRIKPIDIGLLFIQYAEDAQDSLYDFMSQANK